MASGRLGNTISAHNPTWTGLSSATQYRNIVSSSINDPQKKELAPLALRNKEERSLRYSTDTPIEQTA